LRGAGVSLSGRAIELAAESKRAIAAGIRADVLLRGGPERGWAIAARGRRRAAVRHDTAWQEKSRTAGYPAARLCDYWMESMD
jgi:hypothetical protein